MREADSILVDEFINGYAGGGRDHLQRLHLLIMTLSHFIGCVHSWLFCHNSLRKLVILIVNSGGFALLKGQTKRAGAHWTLILRSYALEFMHCPGAIDLPLLLLQFVTKYLSVSIKLWNIIRSLSQGILIAYLLYEYLEGAGTFFDFRSQLKQSSPAH